MQKEDKDPLVAMGWGWILPVGQPGQAQGRDNCAQANKKHSDWTQEGGLAC